MPLKESLVELYALQVSQQGNEGLLKAIEFLNG